MMLQREAYNTINQLSELMETPIPSRKLKVKYKPFDNISTGGGYTLEPPRFDTPAIYIAPWAKEPSKVVRHEAGHYLLFSTVSKGDLDLERKLFINRTWQNPMLAENPSEKKVSNAILENLVHEIFAFYCQGLTSDTKFSKTESEVLNYLSLLASKGNLSDPSQLVFIEELSNQPLFSRGDSRRVTVYNPEIKKLVELYCAVNDLNFSPKTGRREFKFLDIYSSKRPFDFDNEAENLIKNKSNKNELKRVENEMNSKLYALAEWYGLGLSQIGSILGNRNILELFAEGNGSSTCISSSSYIPQLHLESILKIASPRAVRETLLQKAKNPIGFNST